MSTPLLSSSSEPPPPPPSNYLSQNIGLGYSIAIALSFLVLFSTLLLASYVCCRRRRPQSPPNPNPNRNGNGIILPQIVFVAEDDDDGGHNFIGLDQSAINSYPKFPFTRNPNPGGGIGNGSGSECSICLCEYKDSEMLRMMPDCRHYFHLTCIDAWLKLNASCPVCRNSPLPTPLSTPLSEVVPLSQYSNGRRR